MEIITNLVNQLRSLTKEQLDKVLSELSKESIVNLYKEIGENREIIYCSYCKSFEIKKER